MFEDLECPDCARAYPLVWEAAKKHNIPVVLHDFPLNMHPWSFDAAVYARYFDTKSEKLGDDFRGYIFKNQPQIDKQTCASMSTSLPMTIKRRFPLCLILTAQLKAKIWRTATWARKSACSTRLRSL